MTIFDNPPTSLPDPVKQGAIRASHMLSEAFFDAEKTCNAIKKIFDNRTHTAIDIELGVEAADFETKYNLIKDFANNHPNCNAPDLPA